MDRDMDTVMDMNMDTVMDMDNIIHMRIVTTY